MKFGPLIEYNMRKIFAEKSYTKCSGETIPIFCMVLKQKFFSCYILLTDQFQLSGCL